MELDETHGLQSGFPLRQPQFH
uniref:Uncharacterized protein n=1 Tax=Moniliophthora roreri TaxID=221103 RepID=A0A0W0G275_MONRR